MIAEDLADAILKIGATIIVLAIITGIVIFGISIIVKNHILWYWFVASVVVFFVGAIVFLAGVVVAIWED